MIERTGRHLGDNRGEADGSTLRDKRAMHSSCFSRAQHRAKIVRILYSIEKHEKRRLISFLRPLENVLRVAIGFRGHERDGALVFSTRYQAVKCRLGLDVNWNVVGLRELNKLGKLSIDSKDEQPLQGPSLRTEGLTNGVQPI